MNGCKRRSVLNMNLNATSIADSLHKWAFVHSFQLLDLQTFLALFDRRLRGG